MGLRLWQRWLFGPWRVGRRAGRWGQGVGCIACSMRVCMSQVRGVGWRGCFHSHHRAAATARAAAVRLHAQHAMRGAVQLCCPMRAAPSPPLTSQTPCKTCQSRRGSHLCWSGASHRQTPSWPPARARRMAARPHAALLAARRPCRCPPDTACWRSACFAGAGALKWLNGNGPPSL